jgi:hypothetical protein
MNEQTNDELTHHEILGNKLTATYRRILSTFTFCCIGWPLFLYGFYYAEGSKYLFIIPLSAIIVAGPILYNMLRGGGLKAAFRTDEYEIITQYRDGRKETDHGVQSFFLGLVIKIFLALFLVVVGCVLTSGMIIVLSIKYTVHYIRISPKPAFIKSAYPILIVGLLLLAVAPYILRLIFG